MAGGIFDADGGALREAEKRKPLQTQCVHDSLQIGHHGFEGQVLHIPVRQAICAFVITDEPEFLG